MTAVILLSIIVVGLVMLAMSVGAMFSNRCLRGSCGGPEVLGRDGESLNCAACPHRTAPLRVAGDEGAGDEIRVHPS